MAKFNAKNLALFIFLGILLIGVIRIVYAQEVLPKGGDNFESAIEIQPGTYEGHGLESKEVEYFYIKDIGPRQGVDMKGTFVAASANAGAEAILGLYSEDKEKLVEEAEPGYADPVQLTVSWPHTGKDSNKYYIKVGSGLFKIASFSLEVSLKEAPAGEVEEDVPADTVEGVEGVPAEGSNWALILGIIAIIVIIGVVAYFLLKRKKQESPKRKNNNSPPV